MSLAILFQLLCAQHVSDINISIFRSLRLCWWITTSVFLFSVRCVLELLLPLVFGGVRFAGWSLQNDVVIHQQSRRLLKMDILMSETCWAHNKWNKIASDIKLVFHSSTNEKTIKLLTFCEMWSDKILSIKLLLVLWDITTLLLVNSYCHHEGHSTILYSRTDVISQKTWRSNLAKLGLLQSLRASW